MKHRSLALAALLGLNLSAAQAQDPHPHPPVHDGRAVLALTAAERVLLLEEMHMFLDGVQKITAALGKQDMPAVAESARGLGQKAAHGVPAALRAKLPQEFRQLGFSVHSDFDQMALDADNLQDVSHSLGQLSATLQKCAACHATYQIQVPLHPLGR